MLKFYSLAILVALAINLPSSKAERLRFAWPDGASAKVQVRNAGKQVEHGKTDTWDMSCDFAMQLKRVKDQIVVSRNDVTAWKGTFPPALGGGAEQFVHMVPTVIATADGTFVGIEGHETARKLMVEAVEQSGKLTELERNFLQTMSANASLEAMARDHWSSLAVVWRLVELDPGAIYKFKILTTVPQLGGGEIEINGTVEFIKETSCDSPRNNQRCVHFYSESGGDKAQVSKIVQSLIEKAGPEPVVITDWDQRIKVEMVVEKKTMLPQRLKMTRFHTLTVKHKILGESQTSGGEYSTTYTYDWLLKKE
jgi:hypothetical protein